MTLSKYTWGDTSFDADKGDPPLTELEIQALQVEHFQKGQFQALDGIEAQTKNTLESISQELSRLNRHFQENLYQDSLTVGKTIVQVLWPKLSEKGDLPELESLIKETTEKLMNMKDLRIKVAPDMLDSLQHRLQDLNVQLVGDDMLTPGKCSIQWADGSIIRDPHQTMEKIQNIIDTYTQKSTTQGDIS